MPNRAKAEKERVLVLVSSGENFAPDEVLGFCKAIPWSREGISAITPEAVAERPVRTKGDETSVIVFELLHLQLASLHTTLSLSKGAVTDVDQTVKGAVDIGNRHERQRDEQGEGEDLQGLKP